MRAPPVYVVVKRGDSGADFIAWTFSAIEARDEARRLNNGDDWPYDYEEVSPLGELAEMERL